MINSKANDFNNKIKKQEMFKKELNNCKNLKEFFDIIEKYYDLKGTELGVITKPMLMNGIDKIIIATGAKLK